MSSDWGGLDWWGERNVVAGIALRWSERWCSDVLGEEKEREVSWARAREGAGGCEGQKVFDSCGWCEGSVGLRWLDILVCAF